MMKCIIVGTTYWNIINHRNGIVGKSILLWVVGQPPFVIISSVHCPELLFYIVLHIFMHIHVYYTLYRLTVTFNTPSHNDLNYETFYYLYQFQLLMGILMLESVWKCEANKFEDKETVQRLLSEQQMFVK